MYTDEFGTVWEREVHHMGAALKLACPGEGRIVSVLFYTAGETIRYSVPRTDVSQHPWPPDPDPMYAEKCECGQCLGRLVGASADILLEEVILLDSTPTANEDTYFLKYLQSGRNVVELAALSHGFQPRRDTSALTHTYERPNRKVIVHYDQAGEVEHVQAEPNTASYAATLRGALDALAG
jgi:hypothetical protein